jgi:hypothetical protein
VCGGNPVCTNIDRLIWIHEHLAEGGTQQRWKGRRGVRVRADGRRTWMQRRASSFDFPLHFALKEMCNNPDGFNVFAQFSISVTVRNKLLAYAYILTSDGYPCVFYRDYSKDKNCFALKDNLFATAP